MITIVVAIVILCFVFIVYENKQKQLQNDFSVPELALASASVSFLLYLLFFHYADYIRSFNIKFPHEEFIPPARAASYEYDGIEGYTLYALMFVNILLAFIFVKLVSRIKNRMAHLALFLILALVAAAYFVRIGFIPSMSNLGGNENRNPFVMIVTLIVTGLVWLAYKKLNEKLFLLLLGVLLIPVCFIATSAISIFDFSFILSPALRLVDGNPLSDIYFQYDLFLSLLAAAWMKLNIDLNLFQILGQLSFFLLFIGVFIFSKRFFTNKSLPVLLLISLLIVRYYAIMHEPVAIFQVTPLRLELWVILLLLVFYKGAYHWINAVVIGLLLMFHKNFGLIWLLSYYQLIFALFVIDFVDAMSKRKSEQAAVATFFKKQLSLNFKNVLIIAGFVIASIIMFKGFIPKSALLYQQIGVGMIQILPQSFYWYFPIVLSLCFVLLIKYKNFISTQYFQTGLFIVFVTIGNSIYFFGRSHEHNVLNIATSLLLTVFLMFDLLSKGQAAVETSSKPKAKKANQEPDQSQKLLKFKTTIVSALPFLIVAGAAFYYSDTMGRKVKTQYKNLKKGEFIYPLERPTDFASIKKITNNSDSVYFLNYQDDFMYYYYGHYKPVGYFSPCATWILKTDLLHFVQGLLDKHYYVVTADVPRIAELLPNLHYNNVASEGIYTALSKDSVELLLPENSATSVAHIGIGNDLGKNGINLKPLTFKEDFTVELIVKPRSEQVPNSSIIVNAMTDSIGPGGITIQQNGANHNQFLFAYGGGKVWTPPAMFMLRPNEWNYIAVAVKKNKITVYNNGQVMASEKSDFPVKNVAVPLVIGNGIGRDNQFNGLIREVKIMNDTLSEQAMMQNLSVVKTKLK
jgi:hypothetical protein